MAGRTVVAAPPPVESSDRAVSNPPPRIATLSMPIGDRVLESLFYGRFRRPIRGVLNRLLGESPRIVRGPLKGSRLTSAGTAYLLGLYEVPVAYAVRDSLASGDVMYDIGAHEGYFSLLAARTVGRNGFVYAFEPLPENAERVTAHLLENNIEQSLVLPCAISNRSGMFPLSLADAATPSLVSTATRTIDVPVTTLDEFIRQHRPPDVIKVDVEGAEVLVLQGARTLISEVGPKWIIEVHNAELYRGVAEILQAAGYELSVIPPSHGPADKPYPCHVVAVSSDRFHGSPSAECGRHV
jgi:FkbM family methyltransferase